MPPTDDQITALMAKYARREKLTDEEMRILEEWRQGSRENQQMMEEFGDLEWVRSEMTKLKEAPMEEIWEGINKYLNEIGAPDDRDQAVEWGSPELSALPGPPRGKRRWIKRVSVAATIIICVCGLWLLYQKYRAPVTTKAVETVAKRTAPENFVPADNEVVLTGNKGRKVNMNAEPKGTQIFWTKNVYVQKTDTNHLTLFGADQQLASGEGVTGSWEGAPERQSDTVWRGIYVGKSCSSYVVQLPDGSDVYLAGGASFLYPEVDGREPQTYILDGKAFFDVKHDGSRVFTVRTQDGKVQVMGTSFFVDASKERAASIIKLFHGKVRVQSGADSIDVRPAQEAVFGVGRVDLRPLRDSMEVMAWVESSRFVEASHYFVFDNTRFDSAVAAVASWYHYTVDNPQGLLGIPITDKLRKDASPEGILSIIGKIESGYLRLRVKDRVIQISKKPPQHQ